MHIGTRLTGPVRFAGKFEDLHAAQKRYDEEQARLAAEQAKRKAEEEAELDYQRKLGPIREFMADNTPILTKKIGDQEFTLTRQDLYEKITEQTERIIEGYRDDDGDYIKAHRQGSFRASDIYQYLKSEDHSALDKTLDKMADLGLLYKSSYGGGKWASQTVSTTSVFGRFHQELKANGPGLT